jgi:hypothetical protein
MVIGFGHHIFTMLDNETRDILQALREASSPKLYPISAQFQSTGSISERRLRINFAQFETLRN